MLLSSVLWAVDASPDGAPLVACALIEPMHPPHNRSTETIPFGPDLSKFLGRKYVPGQGYNSEYTLKVVFV